MVIIFIISPPPIQQPVYDLMLPVSYKWRLQETVPNISQIIQWAKRLINNSSKIGSKVQPSKDAAAMRKAYFCKPPNNGSSSLFLSACSFKGTMRSACYENQEFCAKKVILPFFPLSQVPVSCCQWRRKMNEKGKQEMTFLCYKQLEIRIVLYSWFYLCLSLTPLPVPFPQSRFLILLHKPWKLHET